MVSQVLKRLRNTNKKMHSTLLKWFSDYEYRADAFVDEYLSILSEKLEEEGISDTEFADKAGVNKSAVSQFFNSDSNVKVKTLFKYADAIGLSLGSPKLMNFDVKEIYRRYENEVSSPSKFYSLKELQSIKPKFSNSKDSKNYQDFNVQNNNKSVIDYKPTG